jgi:hypothetical protein
MVSGEFLRNRAARALLASAIVGTAFVSTPTSALAAGGPASGVAQATSSGCHYPAAWKEGDHGGGANCVQGAAYVRVKLTCAREAGGSNYVVFGPRVWSWNSNNPSRALCRYQLGDVVVRADYVLG